MADIISGAALRYLPFKSESISSWRHKTDLAVFLFELFNQPCVITAPDGSRHESNYSSYGKHLFQQGITDMMVLAKELSVASLDVHHQNPKRIRRRKHNFLKDSQFGEAAKALIAWKAVDSAILSESAFISIYHILEAGSDLDCSVNLAKTHFYKQGAYCLRAFVENITLPLFFSKNPDEFALWKRDQFRVPRFRGKGGLLEQLIKQKLIDRDLADQIAAVYGRLNAYVHSSVENMIHRGHDTGEWRGLCFKLDEFHNWCGLAAECIDASVRMAKVQTDIWLSGPGADPHMCTICHAKNNYSTRRKMFASQPLLELTCNQCGHVWSRRPITAAT